MNWDIVKINIIKFVTDNTIKHFFNHCFMTIPTLILSL